MKVTKYPGSLNQIYQRVYFAEELQNYSSVEVMTVTNIPGPRQFQGIGGILWLRRLGVRL